MLKQANDVEREEETADETAPTEEASSPTTRRAKWVRPVLLGGLPLLVVATALAFWITGGRHVGTDNAYLKANRVQISADLSGRVVDVLVDENQLVKKGEILFQIDDAPLKIAVAKAEAQLADAKNEIAVLRARLRQSEAALNRTRADAGFTEREFDRQEALQKSNVTSVAKVDASRNAMELAEQRVAEIVQEHASLLAAFSGNGELPAEEHPKYLTAKAVLDQALIDLYDATITAPTNGVISQIDHFRPGDYVRKGVPVFTLIETENMWVEANMKETDLTYVREGQEVAISIDTYPGHEWHGRVGSLSAATGAEFAILPPQNAVGNWVKIVQRVPVKIELVPVADAPPLRLGMSAHIKVDTGLSRIARWRGEPEKKSTVEANF